MASTIRNLNVSFGLVEFPASLRKASEKNDVKFDQAVRIPAGKNKNDEPVFSYEKVVQHRIGASTGAVVTTTAGNGSAAVRAQETSGEIVKGVWVSETEFHPLPVGALEQISDNTQIDGIEIEEFVPLKNIDWYRVEGAYYLVPQKGLIGARPMKYLRDALKAEKAAGVAKLCLKGTGGRQKLGVIHVANDRLIVNLLAFAHDFRDADESAQALEGVAIDRKLLALTRQLVREKLAPESTLLDEAVDDAVAERERLYIETMEANAEFTPKTRAPKDEGVPDLMAALERSLEEVRG